MDDPVTHEEPACFVDTGGQVGIARLPVAAFGIGESCCESRQ